MTERVATGTDAVREIRLAPSFDEAITVYLAAIRAEAGTLDVWARWIVRQGRNPQPGCPECGPLGMDQAPSLCVPHQALARLAEAGRE